MTDKKLKRKAKIITACIVAYLAVIITACVIINDNEISGYIVLATIILPIFIIVLYEAVLSLIKLKDFDL